MDASMARLFSSSEKAHCWGSCNSWGSVENGAENSASAKRCFDQTNAEESRIQSIDAGLK